MSKARKPRFIFDEEFSSKDGRDVSIRIERTDPKTILLTVDGNDSDCYCSAELTPEQVERFVLSLQDAKMIVGWHKLFEESPLRAKMIAQMAEQSYTAGAGDGKLELDGYEEQSKGT